MSWVKEDFITVKGYDEYGSKGKRWITTTLDKLLEKTPIVEDYLKKMKTYEDIARFVIEEFDYPYTWWGKSTDKHCFNCFGGWIFWKWSGCIEEDYWQSISESLMIHKHGGKGYGDCEDTSLLFTGLMNHKFGNVAYTMFGLVYDNTTDELKGGHGWAIFKDELGTWRLYESTLDNMPKYPYGFPAINPNLREFIVGNVRYFAFFKFNAFEFYNWDYLKSSFDDYVSKRRTGRGEKRKIQWLRGEWKNLYRINALYGVDENGRD